MEAMRAAEASAAQQCRSTIVSASETASVAAAAATLESMCTQWQL